MDCIVKAGSSREGPTLRFLLDSFRTSFLFGRRRQMGAGGHSEQRQPKARTAACPKRRRTVGRGNGALRSCRSGAYEKGPRRGGR